ncbi:MAG TPA: hypothetical protein VF173_03825 [Thermoanaerobaculia bacterium]|nr:hypothetical protein [Thermoanaerobaculia bacterium]
MSEPSVPPPPSYTPPPPPAGTPPGAADQNRTIMLVLAYLGPLALVPWLVEKNDAEVQWHAKHGLVIFVAEIVIMMALGILHFVPFLGCVIGVVTWGVMPFVFLILAIVCILKATSGQRFLIPGLSEFANRF